MVATLAATAAASATSSYTDSLTGAEIIPVSSVRGTFIGVARGELPDLRRSILGNRIVYAATIGGRGVFAA